MSVNVSVRLDDRLAPALANALRGVGIDVTTVGELRLTGASDPEVFAAAQSDGRAILTENVADSTALAADASVAGAQHAGVLIALSSRFSRRPAGLRPLVSAIQSVVAEDLADRVVSLRSSSGEV